MVAAVVIWFIAASAIIYYVSITSLVEFDPKMKLSEAIMSLSFEHELVSLLNSTKYNDASQNDSSSPDISSQVQAKIYHFFQGDCYCERLASAHQSRLTRWSSQEGFSNINIDVKESRVLAKSIPSTPAVAVVNQQGELIYLGPYSRGAGCFADSGQIDDFLAAWIAQQNTGKSKQSAWQHSQNAIIDTDAKGCYCAT